MRAYARSFPGRIICLLLIGSTLLFTGGCSGAITSNYREVSTLQPVQTIGVDKDGKGFCITISTGEWGDQQSSVIISRSAQTIATCLQAVQDYSAKNELYYPQVRFFILGDNMTKETISSFIGYLENSNVFRLDSSVFIIKGGSAKDIITTSGEKNYDITECLSTIKTDVKLRGEGAVFTCSEMFRSLSMCGSALVCAVESSSLKDAVYSKSGENTAIPAGYAILKEKEICAFIDRDDCMLGANLLLNQSGEGPATVSEEDGKFATLSLNSAKTEYSAEWSNGKITKLTANVKISAQLLSPGTEDRQTTPEYFENLKTQLEKQAKLRCERVLHLSQVLRSDFLWLGPTLRSKYPSEYKKLSGEFSDAFASADTEVNVTATIVRSIVDKPS